MTSAPAYNNFEGGTDTNTIATSGSGGVSGIPWDNVTIGSGATLTYSATQKLGGLSAKTVQPATGVTTYLAWTGLGSITTNTYYRWYFWVSTASVSNLMLSIRNNAAAVSCYFGVNTSGRIIGQNAAGTTVTTATTSTVTVNTWHRLECRVLSSTTVGELEWRVFIGNNVNGAVPDETKSVTAQVLAANSDAARFGHGVTSGFAFNGGTGYTDEVAFSTLGWIGAAAQPRPAIVLNQSVMRSAIR